MIFDCWNCNEKIPSVYRDKVNNKLVCFECMTYSIENCFRFSTDFEEIN